MTIERDWNSFLDELLEIPAFHGIQERIKQEQTELPQPLREVLLQLAQAPIHEFFVGAKREDLLVPMHSGFTPMRHFISLAKNSSDTALTCLSQIVYNWLKIHRIDHEIAEKKKALLSRFS